MLENTHFNQNPPISIGTWHLHNHITLQLSSMLTLFLWVGKIIWSAGWICYTRSHTQRERERHTHRERFNWPLTSFWIEDRSCVLNVWAIVEELCPYTAVLLSVSPLLPSFHLTVSLSLAQLPTLFLSIRLALISLYPLLSLCRG